jgi:hypothetical protein
MELETNSAADRKPARLKVPVAPQRSTSPQVAEMEVDVTRFGLP